MKMILNWILLSIKTIHINNKENLKFYSFPKDVEKLPEPNKEDDLNGALNKIKKIIEIVPKYDKVSYGELIEFLFNSEKKKFLKIDNKISYLLTFLNLKLTQLSQIKEKYDNIKKKIKIYSKRVNSLKKFIKEESDEATYEKFINKYGIKVNKNQIFEYLNYLVNYIIPLSPENEEDYLDEEKFVSELEKEEEKEKKFKKKEKELRNNLNELFDKDPKFINYISYYLWQSLVNYINNNEPAFKKEFLLLEKNIFEKNIFLKLEEIENVILAFKLYNFNIEEDFEKFAKNYEETLPTKKIKKTENETVIDGIINYITFIEKLKHYIKDIDEKVIITNEEPAQFILNLFLEKIGLDCI